MTWLLLAVPVFAWIAWRLLNRITNLPCPFWLNWLMETPYQKWILSTEECIRRADIHSGQKVLDLGCGSGRISIELAKLIGKNGHLVCADLQKGMLDKLRSRFHDNDFNIPEIVKAEASLIDVGGQLFDRIIMVMLLGEVSDRDALFEKLRSMLEPDGIVSISEVFPDPHYQSRRAVTRMAEKAGFRPTQKFGNFWSHTTNFAIPFEGKPFDLTEKSHKSTIDSR